MMRIVAALALSLLVAPQALACGMRIAPEKQIALAELLEKIDEGEAKPVAAPTMEEKTEDKADASLIPEAGTQPVKPATGEKQPNS